MPDVAAGSEAGPACYALHGLTLAGDFPFASRLLPCSRPPDVYVQLLSHPLPDQILARPAPAYTSRQRAGNGESAASVYRLPEEDFVHLAGIADFRLSAASQVPGTISVYPVGTDQDAMVEIALLGSVLAFWLERAGVRALHASAVVVEDRAAAFLGSTGSGKSSLAAALMDAGHRLLTDDLLAVSSAPAGGSSVDRQFIAHPGQPQMRLWPSQAVEFLGEFEGFPQVLPECEKRRVPVGSDGLGTFCPDSRPLAGIYVPERRPAGDHDPQVRIEPVSSGDAVMLLLRHSYLPVLVDALGQRLERLAFFSRLVSRIPVRRISYPSGFEHLPRVREAILADLDAGV